MTPPTTWFRVLTTPPNEAQAVSAAIDAMAVMRTAGQTAARTAKAPAAMSPSSMLGAMRRSRAVPMRHRFEESLMQNAGRSRSLPI
jgi:hypothetical protein